MRPGLRESGEPDILIPSGGRRTGVSSPPRAVIPELIYRWTPLLGGSPNRLTDREESFAVRGEAKPHRQTRRCQERREPESPRDLPMPIVGSHVKTAHRYHNIFAIVQGNVAPRVLTAGICGGQRVQTMAGLNKENVESPTLDDRRRKMTGRVAVMTKPLSLELREFPIPEPEPDALVVRVLRANVCGSELHIWKGLHPAKKTGVLGHEMIGQIERMGSRVQSDYAGRPVKPGDRVVCTYFITCRKCPACLLGQFHLCENAYKYWNLDPETPPHFHGSFATHYYVHPDQYFYKVPDNVPDSAAASANCALSQVLYGIEQAQLTSGQTIVIQGAGGLGINAVAVAKDKGATVIVLDTVDARLKQAERFGADYTINVGKYDPFEDVVNLVRQATRDRGADVTMEVAGVPQAFVQAFPLTRAGGTVVEMGNVSPGLNVEFDPGLLTRRSIKVLPIVRYQPWYLEKALQFLSRTVERFPFSGILDGEFSLENVETALSRSARREVTRASIINT